MKRWRTVGLVGVQTDDGRTLTGTVTVRENPLPLIRLARRQKAHNSHTSSIVPVMVRTEGTRIEALLRWRDRHATLDLDDATMDWTDDLLTINSPTVIGLHLVPGGRSAWASLR